MDRFDDLGAVRFILLYVHAVQRRQVFVEDFTPPPPNLFSIILNSHSTLSQHVYIIFLIYNFHSINCEGFR